MNLEKRLAELKRKKRGILARGQAAATTEEARRIGFELEAVNDEIAETEEQLEEQRNEIPAGGLSPEEMIARGYQRVDGNQHIAGGNTPLSNAYGHQYRGAGSGGINGARILGTYFQGNGTGQQQQRGYEPEDVYSTLEYRQAFMRFAKTGEVTPELRSDAMTTTSDVTAVIPSTIMNEVVQNMKMYGQLFARVRKVNIKGGVTVPILSLKPTATWIGQASTSDKQKVQANTNVTFSYYGLECKVSTSLLADTVTLSSFEATIMRLITEAMIKAVEISIVSGNGTSACLGITTDSRVQAGQIVTMSEDELGAWDSWKKNVFAKMPLAYKAGATFLMASGTFEGYIDGMVDANGQPIGRINYGITNGPQETFGGKEVILVEDDIIANYADASSTDVIAIYCNLDNYAFNSNMQMTMYRYLDHDTNEWIDKAILIADGRLIDPNGVVIIKKA
jgi:HK97 family phage major capsid protein